MAEQHPKEVSREAIEALLAFYVEAGVDCCLSNEPIDRFAAAGPEPAIEPQQASGIAFSARRSEPAPPAAPRRDAVPTAPAAVEPALTVPSPDAVMAAREAARSAESLEALKATLESFEGCNLRVTATQLVFADGNPEGRVMLVGEAPGRDEDIQGLPFVGRSGQLLNRMLAAIGLDRTSVYIANVIPWRPPGNRTPTPLETEICRPFIERQIALADPDFLVLLGGAAAKQILQTSEGITRLRGRWRPYHSGRRDIRAMAMLHPAGLLRRPEMKRLAWRDLLTLKAALEGRD
jgi:uracil-DNA glycosylase